jgi:hypothetical protein
MGRGWGGVIRTSARRHAASIIPVDVYAERTTLMNTIQKVITKIVPRRWAQDMETESRAWIMTCPNCRAEQSLWDAGGIRWKAYSNKSVFMRCPQCGKMSNQKMVKK